MLLSGREIRKALLDVGATQAGIARTLGVSKQSVNEVILGGRRTPRIRRAVADAIGMTYSRVWGESDPDLAPTSSAPGTASLPDTSSNVARSVA